MNVAITDDGKKESDDTISAQNLALSESKRKPELPKMEGGIDYDENQDEDMMVKKLYNTAISNSKQKTTPRKIFNSQDGNVSYRDDDDSSDPLTNKLFELETKSRVKGSFNSGISQRLQTLNTSITKNM